MRELTNQRVRVGKEEIRYYRHERRLAHLALDRRDDILQALRLASLRQRLPVQIETIQQMGAPDARPRRRQRSKLLVERDQAEEVLEERRRQTGGSNRA